MGEEREGPKWTEAGLRAIQPTGRREQFSDPATPGLVLLMTPAGAKTFYLVYRAGGGRRGRRRWYKIGRLTLDLGLATARQKAIKARGEVMEGRDPQGERQAGRKAPAGATVADLCTRFETEYLDGGKVAASTAVTYRQHITARIRPGLGALTIREVRQSHVTAFLEGIAATAPGQAQKVRATLSRMFNRAELWELREPGTNPVRGQDPGQKVHRQVRLTDAQVASLGAVLATQPWQAKALVAVLLCTGMRVSELAGRAALHIPPLPWADVDLAAGVIWLKRHKTVKKIGPKPIYLCPEMVVFLETLPSEDLVLGGWRNATDAWGKIRKAAGIPGVNLHDLRHTFSSVGDDLGFSEATVGALLGHAAASQTGRYTHKLSRDLQAAAGAIGGRLWGLLGLPLARVAER